MDYKFNAAFGPVAPIHILEDLQRLDSAGLFGWYHLFLAHHTVEHPARFRRLLEQQFSKHPHGYLTVIMDNSLVELGGAVDDKMIREAVETITIYNPESRHLPRRRFIDVVPVLPDVMGNGPDTVEASADGYHRWMANGMPGDGYMLVTQGANWEEFTNLVNFFFVENREDFRNIRWVGIPRKLVQTIGTRARAVKYVQMVAPQAKIHLLGFSGEITDDMFCARMSGVLGIDSAVPVRYGKVLTPMTSEEEIGPRGTWWEDGQVSKVHCDNIRSVRSWLSK